MYDRSSALILYSTYCHGVCDDGKRNLMIFPGEQGADPNRLGYPKGDK